MRATGHSPSKLALPALLGVLLSLSGCSYLEGLSKTPPTEPVVQQPQLPPDLPTEPEVPAEPVPTTVRPVAEPDPDPLPPASADSLRVAVLLSSRTAAYENVATALAEKLDTVDIYDLSDKSLTPKEMFDSIQSAGSEVIVAIGMRATAFARTFEDMPVVFSQVFNSGQFDGADTGKIRGVSVLPPLDLQIAAWREVNPSLSSIGAIVGSGHDRLIEEAAASAEAHGVRFSYRLAQSDRETLYLFTRLVPDIDGFWLFPDNRILSASVLRQMLTYASRHRVQVAVFNDSLLALGATISTTSVDADIAETIVSVASQLLTEGGVSVPHITPLKRIQVRTRLQSSEQVASDARESKEGVY